MRFRTRGYENIYSQTYINGVPFNDQLRGVFNFSSIGAINDFTRNGDAINYSQPGQFAFGSIGGGENIRMRAGDYGHGGKATLTYTNRNYWMRAMMSYHTGLSDKGWAFSALVGGRYSNEGVIDGTFYRNFSYALMLEKRWGNTHSLTLTTFGSPVCRGQQGGTVQEVYDLTGNNLYNPNWGYQNGKKRNARVVQSFDPTTVLAHEWNLSRDIKSTRASPSTMHATATVRSTGLTERTRDPTTTAISHPIISTTTPAAPSPTLLKTMLSTGARATPLSRRSTGTA